MSIKDNIKKVRDNVYEVPGSVNKKMRASGRLYLDDESFEALEDGAIDQIVNIACLPGVHRYAIGLPDIHFGYGFPIGGVAAFNEKNGIVSPGGVGFDINCGVRLIKTNLKQADIEDKLDELIEALFKNILLELVTFDVFHLFDTYIVLMLLHKANIPFIVSTFDVSKELKSKTISALQLINISGILITLLVLKLLKSKFINELHP